jgi:hypothetical protein
MKMQIDEIQIIPTKPQNGLVGFCSFVLERAFYVSGIAIYTRPQGGFRLVYPSKKLGLAERSIFYPIRKEIGDFVEQEVTKKIEEVVTQNDRYDCANL